MADEHIERQINFIIEHHVKFIVDMQKLQEAQARTDGMLRKLVDVVDKLARRNGGAA